MIKRFLCLILVLGMFAMPLGCARLAGYSHTPMPTITVPTAPVKPQIKAVTVKQGDKVYVGYTVPDALKLYKFLLEKDAYEDKLIFRIDEMNKLIKDFGRAK